MESTKTNQGLLYGLISAGLVILLTVIQYVGGVKWFLSPLAYLGFVIPIVMAVLGGLVHKKANGGFLEFKDALKTVFTVFTINIILTMLFVYVLFNFIDVPFRQALSQEAAVYTEEMFEKLKVPQDQIDKAVAETLNGNSYALKNQLLAMAMGSIVWFIVSLIIAAIIKKKKPLFEENSFQQ